MASKGIEREQAIFRKLDFEKNTYRNSLINPIAQLSGEEFCNWRKVMRINERNS